MIHRAEIEPYFAEEARKRQAHGMTAPGKTLVEKVPQALKSRDQAAAAVGVSGKLVSAAKAIKEADPEENVPQGNSRKAQVVAVRRWKMSHHLNGIASRANGAVIWLSGCQALRTGCAASAPSSPSGKMSKAREGMWGGAGEILKVTEKHPGGWSHDETTPKPEGVYGEGPGFTMRPTEATPRRSGRLTTSSHRRRQRISGVTRCYPVKRPGHDPGFFIFGNGDSVGTKTEWGRFSMI